MSMHQIICRFCVFMSKFPKTSSFNKMGYPNYLYRNQKMGYANKMGYPKFDGVTQK